MTTYASSPGGHPGQDDLMTGRAVFTEAYAVIPKGVQRDIVTSNLPHFRNHKAWVLARPMTGFSETFAHMIVTLSKDGGSDRPEPDPDGEGVVFVTQGELDLKIDGTAHRLPLGGYAFLPAGSRWQISNSEHEDCTFHWIRKAYDAVDDVPAPSAFVTSDSAGTVVEMEGTMGRWSTTRFVDPSDMSHDMHVNIVNFEPGGVIPFEETHVMEHGLFVLEGKAVYKLNRDWVEVEAGDYMWLRAFCPQACYAGGTGRFRYLLYKDVNRHMPLRLR